MTFALIFIIVLSIILLIGAFLIWKSDLPPNDKIVAIIAILAVFSLVSIVNEAKKSTYVDTKLSVAEFERLFFTPPELDLNRVYRLPILDDFKTIVSDTLGGWKAEDPNVYLFGLVYSDRQVGKTLAFKEYAKILQGNRVPTLYLQIKSPNTNIFQFASTLQLSDLHVLDEVIQRFNANGRIPNIFIDNIENAFNFEITNDKSFPCSVCEYMKFLYDNKKVNIIFISNNPVVKDMLQSVETYSRRMNFYDFPERNSTVLQKYLIDKINHGIRPKEKAFEPELINNFVTSLGWDFQILNEYVHNINNYQSIPNYITTTIEKESQRIAAYADLGELVKSVAGLTKGSGVNSWIPYGTIRRVYEGNPSKKLDEAVRANILVKEHNNYRFRNQITYQAVYLTPAVKHTDL